MVGLTEPVRRDIQLSVNQKQSEGSTNHQPTNQPTKFRTQTMAKRCIVEWKRS